MLIRRLIRFPYHIVKLNETGGYVPQGTRLLIVLQKGSFILPKGAPITLNSVWRQIPLTCETGLDAPSQSRPKDGTIDHVQLNLSDESDGVIMTHEQLKPRIGSGNFKRNTFRIENLNAADMIDKEGARPRSLIAKC